MSLLEQINEELTDALKSKETNKVSTLRMLKSAVKNHEIQKGKELSDLEITEVISKQIKQRCDSISEYKKANRSELAQKEENEIKILEKYQPKQMSRDEVTNIIVKVISEVGATEPQDMGKVMGKLMPQVKGKADGNLVSKIVKEKLTK